MEERLTQLEKTYHDIYRELQELYGYISEIAHGTYSNHNEKHINLKSHFLLVKMYNVICVYFETIELNQYLSDFKAKFEKTVNNLDEAIKIGFRPLKYEDDWEDDFNLLIEWEKYLVPFDIFNSLKKEKEIKKVIEFLESTQEILKITNTHVTKEEDINKVIREVAKFYFSGVFPYSQGYFVNLFKNYRPDLIIKELGVVVEYKLIRKNKEVGTKFEELIVDAQGYKGNSRSKYCIAVFCLSKEITKTKKEIKEGWKRMQFPKNWELVVISDVDIKKKK